MIDVSFLYCGIINETVAHRYNINQANNINISNKCKCINNPKRKPVIVWNITRKCNLACKHCYSESHKDTSENELDTQQAIALIDDLAQFGIPVILFSGGEPLMRYDIFELIRYASKKGIRAVLSTNGTLINEQTVNKIIEAKLSYIGISIDSANPDKHNKFRNLQFAFEKSVNAIKMLKEQGQKVGIRVTLTKFNADEMPRLFELADKLNVDRLCFYHLVPIARANETIALPNDQTRAIIGQILELAKKYPKIQVLTVDNPCDGVFIYLKLKRQNPERAKMIYNILKQTGGAKSSSGNGLACIDWNGNVHPDQFSMNRTIGNIKQMRFGDIWQNNNILTQMENCKSHIQGRCKKCKFFEICNGGLRARAMALTGNFWASDPKCYLTDSEILKLKCKTY